MTVEKPVPKVIFPTNHNRSKQRDKLIRIHSNYCTCNLLKGREKLSAQGVIGFGFASQWFEKTGASFFKPVTK